MRTPAEILADVKSVIREPYAWPGGYPRYVVMADGEALSHEAAKEQWREICRATIARDRSGWDAMGADINWEDPALFCAHSGKRIESAYAEDEANPFVCGDGQRFPTLEAAREHANHVHKMTGAIISIERDGDAS